MTRDESLLKSPLYIYASRRQKIPSRHVLPTQICRKCQSSISGYTQSLCLWHCSCCSLVKTWKLLQVLRGQPNSSAAPTGCDSSHSRPGAPPAAALQSRVWLFQGRSLHGGASRHSGHYIMQAWPVFDQRVVRSMLRRFVLWDWEQRLGVFVPEMWLDCRLILAQEIRLAHWVCIAIYTADGNNAASWRLQDCAAINSEHVIEGVVQCCVSLLVVYA